MPRPSAGDKILSRARNHGAGEAAARREHGGAWTPREVAEAEAKGSGGRGRAVDRERARVEEGSAEDVEVVAERDCGEVAETVDLRVAGHGWKRAPCVVLRVEEKGGSDGWVLREDAEEVVAAAVEESGEERLRGGDAVP